MYHHIDTTKKQFVGKTLKGISRVDDSSVKIEFGDGTSCKLSVEGDCCSQSIFYDIKLPAGGLDGAVLEDILEGGGDEESESVTSADSEEAALEKVKASGIRFSPEYNRVWNVVLKTNRGNALVCHINSSNGYYDGYTSYELDSSSPDESDLGAILQKDKRNLIYALRQAELIRDKYSAGHQFDNVVEELVKVGLLRHDDLAGPVRSPLPIRGPYVLPEDRPAIEL